MTAQIEVFLYGDQSTDYYESLQVLVEESKRSHLLRKFLAISWTQLSESVSDLPYVDRSQFAGVNFYDLGERSRHKQRKSLAVSCVLQTVVQIGLTILHREKEARPWQSKQNIRVLGLCTGIVSAIAASNAESVIDLVDIGPDFVLLALRLGLAAAQRGTSIDDSEGAWSVAISGMSCQIASALIDDFHDSMETPPHQQLYVSVISSISVTISGPPKVMKKFLNSEAMVSAHKLALPVWGPFHAEHLTMPDIDCIMSDSKLWSRNVSAEMSLLSPSMKRRGRPFKLLRDLVQHALYDVLQTPIMMDEIFQTLIDEAGGCPINLILLGPSRLGGLLRKLQVNSVSEYVGKGQDTSNGLKQNYYDDDTIAIIGMAGKFPDAEDLDDLWKIIIEGRDLHREIPLSRFDVRSHYDPTGKIRNTSLTPYGCFYDNADKFDLALFKMSPREAAQTDPMQRLMLITSFMALESAGYYDPGPRRPRPKFGTYYGQAGDDYRQVNSSQDIDSNYITGGIRAFGPGRVSYHFGWEGPSMTVDTACSASGVAIHQAVSALRLKECDTALTGGANFLSCSDMFAGLSRAGFLSLTGGCKTLDEKADGYCRADAVATLVLKRVNDAIRDKDRILGLIRGVGTNHAANAVSITHPHAETQAALFKSVLQSAGLTIDDIDHVEMHGTGTQAGDVAEISSITSLLEGKRRPDDHPLFLGAVKPNIGHSEAASGATSLVKGVLMLHNQVIPRFTGIKNRLNPKLAPFETFNICAPTQSLPYTLMNRSKKRRMLVNNFNATGGTTTLILEEYHQRKSTKLDPRDHFPITLSGATARSLLNAIKALHSWLLQSPDIILSHLSYTLTARRMHHAHRFSCTASTISELVGKLETAMTSDVQFKIMREKPVIVFVFTGQGSLYAGMGHGIYRSCRTFRNHIKSADLLCQNLGFRSFLSIIQDPEADMQRYNAVQGQLAVVALEVALAYTLNAWGVEPTIVVGHSLGEYSTLAVSGVLSLADTLFLVGKRAQLMLDKCEPDHSMLVVAASDEEARDAISATGLSKSIISCINGPRQVVIGGPGAEIKLLQAYLSQRTIKSSILKTDFAFHSAQMDPIVSKFRQLATSIEFQPPKMPVASTLLGTIVEVGTEAVLNAEYLARHAREPVKFMETVKRMQDMDTVTANAMWIELGPTNTCLSMVASIQQTDTERLASMLDRNKSNWHTSSEALGKFYRLGGDVFWDEFHREHLDCLEFIEAPTYCFDLTSHFIPYDGDWAITKNQKTKNTRVPVHTLQSATVHSVEDYRAHEGGREMHLVTDVLRENFQTLIATHDVTGTSSGAAWLVADMVVTAALQLWQHEKPAEDLPAFEILPVTGSETLKEVLSSAETIKLVASHDWSNSHIITVSVNIEGLQGRHSSKFKVVFDHANEWSKTANKASYLYRSRIDQFMDQARHGATKEIRAGRTVQLVAEGESTETVATLQLDQNPGTFAIDPAWHEELVGVVGRVLRQPTECVRSPNYEFRGWRSLRLLHRIQQGIAYSVHARLQPTSGPGSISSDIHVLDTDNNIVAVFEDVEYYQTDQHPEKSPTTSVLLEGPLPRIPATGNLTESRESKANGVEDVELNTSNVGLPAKMALDFERIIALVAVELGVDPLLIHDDSLFADLGVDSILQIAITGRLKELLQKNLPESLLTEFASVRKLRAFFEGLYKAENQ